ncbi:hypothetical protein H1C71_021188 [Ictidomys tridecemlineatus]|nr:hypothetical protein H1C71_021188 [Ictidomys tridecemlineatus]
MCYPRPPSSAPVLPEAPVLCSCAPRGPRPLLLCYRGPLSSALVLLEAPVLCSCAPGGSHVHTHTLGTEARLLCSCPLGLFHSSSLCLSASRPASLQGWGPRQPILPDFLMQGHSPEAHLTPGGATGSCAGRWAHDLSSPLYSAGLRRPTPKVLQPCWLPDEVDPSGLCSPSSPGPHLQGPCCCPGPSPILGSPSCCYQAQGSRGLLAAV